MGYDREKIESFLSRNAQKGAPGTRMCGPDRLFDILADALFPRRCPVCGEIVKPPGRLICDDCRREVSFVKSPVCKKCGKEIIEEESEYCPDCARKARTFEYGIALVNYNEAAKRAMAGIKYKNKREYLDFYIDEALKRCGRRLLSMKADGLVPVPVHPARLRERGYNQAFLLAKGLGDKLGLPVYDEILSRDRKTKPQKNLDPSERLENLKKAFRASPAPEQVESVILIDDIYTTGSTVEACSRALKAAGIKKVYFFTVCIGQGR